MAKMQKFDVRDLPDWFVPDLDHKVEGFDEEPDDVRVGRAAYRVVKAGRAMYRVRAGAAEVKPAPAPISAEAEATRNRSRSGITGMFGSASMVVGLVGAGVESRNGDSQLEIVGEAIPVGLGAGATWLAVAGMLGGRRARQLARGTGTVGVGAGIAQVTGVLENSPASGVSATMAGIACLVWASMRPESLATSPTLDIVEAIGTRESTAVLDEWRAATSYWYDLREAYGLGMYSIPDDWPEVLLEAITMQELKISAAAVLPPPPGPGLE